MEKSEVQNCQNCDRQHVTVEKRLMGSCIVKYCLHCYNSLKSGKKMNWVDLIDED